MADIETSIGINLDTSNALAAIKNLQREISAFHTSLAKGSAGASGAAANLQKDLIGNINATGQFSASMTKIRSTTESFTNSLEKNKFSMGEYFRFAGGATKTFGKNFVAEFNTIEKVARERVKDLQTQFISLGRDANGALQAIKIRPMVLDLKDAGTQMQITAQKQQIFNQLLKQGSTNLLNFGKNTQWAGRQLMVGFTLPLTVFGQQAAKIFMDLEKQALRFRRVYGELFTSPEETDSMVKALQELALEFTKYGVAVEKTMELAADAAAMGQTGTALLAQVTEANRLAVLGNVEQAKALETTISVTNAFAVATEDLANKIDFLNAVENQTVTSIEDLTIAIPKAGPVVKQLGGDVEDLAFFLTAMKEGGINASEGANALKSGLASLINPTGKAAEMLAGFGINVNKIVQSNKGDVKGIVIGFAEALDRLDPLNRAQAIEQLFGKFQFSRLSTLFQNVIAEGTQAERVLALANSTVSELSALSEKELGNVADSTTFRFQKSIEELKMAIAPVGEQFLKAITPIIEFATKMLNSFNEMNEGVRNFVVVGGALLAGLGPVVLMTFGLLANGVANLIKGFALVRGMFLKTKDSSSILGEQMEYMTQEQLEAASVAASLERVHQKLEQRFTSEAAAIDNLVRALQRGVAAQRRFNPSGAAAAAQQVAQTPLGLNRGTTSVPGPRGAGDIVPALLSPGEAVIPAKAAEKYAPIIQGMIAGNLPGFNKGVMLGMPRSGKSTGKNREAAEQIYQMFLQSSYANVPPTNYGHQISPTSGHSFPIFGLGGVYMSPAGKKVFVKPVMDEKAALAEMRGTQIARQAHGLEAPEQRIVVMRDPQDVTGKRRFLALESDLDAKFVNNEPNAVFNEEQYFRQLVASLVRVDKDLAAGNLFGNVVADVGPAGVFDRASGVRDYAANLPSMEDQAMINLLGIKGGAKRAFAESTLGLMAKMNAEQYHQYMISEIQKVLPQLKQTVAGFGLTNPQEADAYNAMIKRLEAGLGVDWRKFHGIHSAVKVSAPKQTAKSPQIPGYADGVVSVPGPKGKGDVVPAMLSPGEAVIPADKARRYRGLISAMVDGSIPGYQNSVPGGIPVPERSQAINAAPRRVVASHFDLTTAQNIAGTLSSASRYLSDGAVEIFNTIKKANERGYAVTREMKSLGDAAAEALASGSVMFAGGQAYSGTAVPGDADRNEMFNRLGIAGEPFRLDSLIAAAALAEAELVSGSETSVRWKTQLEELASQGAEQSVALQQSTDETAAHVSYMRQNAKKSIEHSLLTDKRLRVDGEKVTAETASLIAEERLLKIDSQLEESRKRGLSKEALIQEAQDRLIASMQEFSTGQYTIAPAEGYGPKAGRDVARNMIRTSGPFSVERPEDFSMPYRGAMSSEVVEKQAKELANKLNVPIDQAIDLIFESMYSRIDQGLGRNSPSREFADLGKDVSDGVNLASDDAKASGEKIGKTISNQAGASFVKPKTATPTQTESFSLRKVASPVAAQGPEAINVAKGAGENSMGPLRAYFTVVGANLREVVQEFKADVGIVSQDSMGPLQAYLTTVKSNLRQVWTESKAEFGAIFSGPSMAAAGRTSAEKFREGLEAANPQLVLEGKEMGINFAAAAAGRQGGIEAVLTKKNAELIKAATTAWNAGIRDLPKQGASAFSVSGNGIVQEITKSIATSAKALAPIAANAISSNFFDRIPKANLDLGVDNSVGESVPLADAPSRLEKFNSTIMQSSFALSSLASLTYMTGGSLGEFGEAITGMTTAMFALSTVTQLLISLKAKEAVQTAIANAKQIALGSSTAKIFDGIAPIGVGFKKLGSVIKQIVIALPKLVKVVAIAAAAFGAFLFISDQVNKAREKERLALEGLASTANMTKDKLEKLGSFTGTTVQATPFSIAASGLAMPNVESREELNEVVALANNQEFLDAFKDDIASLGNATLKEAELTLKSLSVQLFASGFSEKNISNIINALQSAAGRSDVILDFNEIGISTGSINYENIINEIRLGLADAFGDGPQLEFKKPVMVGDVVFGGANLEDVDWLPNFEKILTTESQGQVNQFAGIIKSQLEALSAELVSGSIDLEEYNTRFAQLMGTVTTSSAAAPLMERLFNILSPELEIGKIKDLNDQLVIFQAVSANVSPEEINKALDGIVKGGPAREEALKNLAIAISSVGVQAEAVGEKARNSLDFGPIDTEIEGLENTKKAYDALIEAKVDEVDAYDMANDAKWRELTLLAIENDTLDELIAKREEYNRAVKDLPPDPEKDPRNELDEFLNKLRQENDLKKKLKDAGISAADSQLILTNEVLKGAAAVAIGTPQWKDFLDQLKDYKNLVPATTGATPDKTPFEQAIEALQDQRKEIINTSTAYTRLRKAGFSAAQAFKAAKDPITAAAVATTKVGTKKWRELLALIRQVDKFAATAALKDLTRDNMAELSLKKDLEAISKFLEKSGYSAEQVENVLSQIKGNPDVVKKIADDLKDGKVEAQSIRDYLKSIRFIKVELSIEDMESQVSSAFSQVSEYFAAQKETIELDFELGTNVSGKNVQNDLTKQLFNTKEIQKAIKDAEEFIAKRQFEIDDNEYQLIGIQEQEDEINEKYDKRIEALNEINEANEELSQQQKAQLTLAGALTSGDMAAAARAVQELRAQQAADAAAKQEKLLEKARDNELKAVRSLDGRSRVEIEEKIKELKDQILKKEEEILEPQQRALDLANQARDAALASVTYLGRNESAWKQVENEVRKAKVEAEGYKKAIEDALALIPKLKAAYAGAPGTSTGVTVTDADPNKNNTASVKEERIAQLNALIQANRDAVTKDKSITPEDRRRMAENIAYIRELRELTGDANTTGGVKRLATGGFVSGPGTPTSDSIPAMLSNGEYVINAKTTKEIGLDTLNAINFGKTPKFARGGLVNTTSLAGIMAASKTPTVAEKLAAAKKADNRIVNKTLAERAAKPPAPATKPKASGKSQEDFLKMNPVKGGSGNTFQAFESGFNDMMNNVGNFLNNTPVVKDVLKFVGDVYSADNLGGQIFRGAIGLLSTPGEIVGALAKNAINIYGKASKGDVLGAVTDAVTAPLRSIVDGTANAFSGTMNVKNSKTPMFQQAAQAAIDNNLFNAQNDPEMAALARIIGGTLTVLGDPLTYLGVGLGVKGVKGTVAAARTAPTKAKAFVNDTRLVAEDLRFSRIRQSTIARKEQEVIARNTEARFEEATAALIRSGAIGSAQPVMAMKKAAKVYANMDRTSIGPKVPVPENIKGLLDINTATPAQLLEIAQDMFFTANNPIKLLDNQGKKLENPIMNFLDKAGMLPRKAPLDTVGGTLRQKSNDLTNPFALFTGNTRRSVKFENPIMDFLYRSGMLPTTPALAALKRQTETLSAVGRPGSPQLGPYSSIMLGRRRGSSGSFVTNPVVDGARDFNQKKDFGPLSLFLNPNSLKSQKTLFAHENKHLFDKQSAWFSDKKMSQSSRSFFLTNRGNAVAEARARAEEALVSGKAVDAYSSDLAIDWRWFTDEKTARNVANWLYDNYLSPKTYRAHQLSSDWYNQYIKTILDMQRKAIRDGNNVEIHSPQTMDKLKRMRDLLAKVGLTETVPLDIKADKLLSAVSEYAKELPPTYLGNVDVLLNTVKQLNLKDRGPGAPVSANSGLGPNLSPLVLKAKDSDLGIDKLGEDKLGAMPGGFRTVNGQNYYIKQTPNRSEATAELFASELAKSYGITSARMQMISGGLGSSNLALLGSRTIGDLLPTSSTSLAKWIGEQPDQAAAAEQLLSAYKEYGLKDAPLNAAIGNMDTHAENVLFDTISKKMVNLDLGNSALTGFAGLPDYRSLGFGDLTRLKGDSLEAIRQYLPKNEIDKITRRLGIGRGATSVTHPYDTSAQLREIERILGFDTSKTSRSVSETNPASNPLIRKMIQENPELAGMLEFGKMSSTSGKTFQEALQTLFTRMKRANTDPTLFLKDGGLVKPKYFNAGGMVKKYARGGDVVPSMLTPGEFVMSKYAVQNYGVDKMKALNSGTYNGDSVYNYEVNISVKSDANPDQIARAVMGQIKQIDAQRIRGNRF
jgi:TP901 family phage tail tape measure protein